MTDPSAGRGIVPPYMEQAAQEAGDVLETIEGVLVMARIGDVSLDREPVEGRVVMVLDGVPHSSSTVLSPDQALRLSRALACAVYPYGSSENGPANPPKH